MMKTNYTYSQILHRMLPLLLINATISYKLCFVFVPMRPNQPSEIANLLYTNGLVLVGVKYVIKYGKKNVIFVQC